jgi:hypothetical protein
MWTGWLPDQQKFPLPHPQGVEDDGYVDDFLEEGADGGGDIAE